MAFGRVTGKCIDICWLEKARGHLDKVEKEPFM